jgi:hypothetical protein
MYNEIIIITSTSRTALPQNAMQKAVLEKCVSYLACTKTGELNGYLYVY